MKTSVIIATYNGARFIKEQLDSIINQTELPSEIVISDDGSTDSTVEIIRQFFAQHDDLPIQYKSVKNEGNHGVLGNFQNAAIYAEGDYIFLCDQDDIWFPNKVERMVEVMDSHDENVYIHNAQVIIEGNENEFKTSDRHLLGNFPFDSNGLYKVNGSDQVWPSFYYCIVQGMCTCIKKDYLKTILPFSKGSNHDNWILFCACADDTLLAVRDDLAFYRIHSNNTCGIQEYKKKRPLSDRIATFDKKGKESILKQYVWYKDTSAYIKDREIKDDKIKILISFFTQDRIKALSGNRISGLIQFLKSDKEGAYSIDGRIILLHDIEYLLLHSRKNRKALLDSLDMHTRQKQDQ